MPGPGGQARVHCAEGQTAGVNVGSLVGMCGGTSRPRLPAEEGQSQTGSQHPTFAPSPSSDGDC